MNIQVQKSRTLKSVDFHIVEMNLDKHWNGISSLLESEGWPFIKEDLEVSHNQDKSIGLVVLEGDEVIAFFTAHNFGTTAYLDMIIIDHNHRTNINIARNLWKAADKKIIELGLDKRVAHCTTDSAPMMKLFGYKPGKEFTLMRKEPKSPYEVDVHQLDPSVSILNQKYLNDLIQLDAEVFGIERSSWLTHLQSQDTTTFYGLKTNEKLIASVCVRTRRDNSICLDGCNGRDFSDIKILIQEIIKIYADKGIECFVNDSSKLPSFLTTLGFQVPDFFKNIGPLIEFRHGGDNTIGTGENMISLSWI